MLGLRRRIIRRASPPAKQKLAHVGHRALRKIDPSIDLTGHLKLFEQLPRPWDAAALFGRAAPLEVEVGSGKGLFLRNAAAAPAGGGFPGHRNRPEIRPIRRGRIGQGRPAKRPGGPGDALRCSTSCSPTIAGGGPRLLSRSLVEEAAPQAAGDAGVVRPRRGANAAARRHAPFLDRRGGVFPNARWNCSPRTTGLLGPLPVPETPAEHDMAYRTHFERRVRLASEPVYRAEFKKAGG